MASFSKDIPLKYRSLNYDGVIQNYKWIQETVFSLFEDLPTPEVRITFEMGDISCTCSSIEEFSEHAYGQKINVYSYDISFSSSEGNKSIAYFMLSNSKKAATLCCDRKDSLIKICTALEEASKIKDTSATPVVQEITTYVHDESTHVTIGDNNTIENANIGANNTLNADKPSPKESFWKPIWQTIAANWIWFAFGLLLIAALAGTGITNTNWMEIF